VLAKWRAGEDESSADKESTQNETLIKRKAQIKRFKTQIIHEKTQIRAADDFLLPFRARISVIADNTNHPASPEKYEFKMIHAAQFWPLARSRSPRTRLKLKWKVEFHKRSRIHEYGISVEHFQNNHTAFIRQHYPIPAFPISLLSKTNRSCTFTVVSTPIYKLVLLKSGHKCSVNAPVDHTITRLSQVRSESKTSEKWRMLRIVSARLNQRSPSLK
jgi:hypothetical protein